MKKNTATKLFFTFPKFMKILWRNGGIKISNCLATVIKRGIIIKRDAEKFAVLWRTVTTGAKMPQATFTTGWRCCQLNGSWILSRQTPA